MEYLKIDNQLITPIFEQIKNNLITAIEQGRLKTGDIVPSINKKCREFSISPGTVIKAYEDLSLMGILSSRKGKGYYVKNEKVSGLVKVFMLFDRMNDYKEILYNSICTELISYAEIQIAFHHYDIARFEKLICDNLGLFHYYVIMPHFNLNVSDIVKKIPEDKLILVDRIIPKLKGKYGMVTQDFLEDIYNALLSGIELINKYKKLNFVQSCSRFQHIPYEILEGFNKFVKLHNLQYSIIEDISKIELEKNNCYIIVNENDMITLIKKAKQKNWIFGKDIGIISYDETPIKEVLCDGISVLSTDFEEMGKSVAKMIKNGKLEKMYNPFQLIVRKSL